MKFSTPMQNETLMATGRTKLKPEVEFQYGSSRSFPKPEVVIAQPWIGISLRNLIQLEILIF